MKQEFEKDELQIYLKEISKIPLIDAKEEQELVVKAKNGDIIAREKLLQSHLRFVVSIAKQHQGQGLPLLDLISEGNCGLIIALDKFDTTRGFRFISYAVWWIKQSIYKALSEQSRTVRLPANLTNLLVQIQKAKKELELDDFSCDSIEKIAEHLNIESEKVIAVLNANRAPVSLETPIELSEDEGYLKDLIEDKQALRGDIAAVELIMKEQVGEVLNKLSEKEAAVLKYRFGLDGNKPKSLKEISLIFNITKERIRQIEARALSKFKEEARELELYVA